MITALRRMFATLAAALELQAAEIRTGVTLVEAVAAQDFESQLRAITVTDDYRDEYRAATLELAKAGLRLDDLTPLFRLFSITRLYDLDTDDLHLYARARDLGQVHPPQPLRAMTDAALNEWSTAVKVAFGCTITERARRAKEARS